MFLWDVAGIVGDLVILGLLCGQRALCLPATTWAPPSCWWTTTGSRTSDISMLWGHPAFGLLASPRPREPASDFHQVPGG